MNRASRLFEGNAVHQVEAAKHNKMVADQIIAEGQFNSGICLAKVMVFQ
jgi:hypothetical protein